MMHGPTSNFRRAVDFVAAARMFEKHPHFTVFPGDSVQIMECLPIHG